MFKKSTNMIMVIDGNNLMILAIKGPKNQRKFVYKIGPIILTESKTYFGEFQPLKLYDQICQVLCKSLVFNLVYYGQNIEERHPIRKIIYYLHVTLVVFQF